MNIPNNDKGFQSGNFYVEGVPQQLNFQKELRYLQYRNVRAAGFAGWLPDGTAMLVVTRFADTGQVFMVKKAGGYRKQLTFFEEGVQGISICPDPNLQAFIFAKDIGGDENFHLFYFDIINGNYHQITSGSAQNKLGVWNKAGNCYFFTSNLRNKTDYDLYVWQTGDKENKPVLLKELKGSWYLSDCSFDDRFLLLGNYHSISESYYYLYDLNDNTLVNLVPKKEEEKTTYWNRAKFSPVRHKLFITGDKNGEFTKLYGLDIKNVDQPEMKLIADDIDWNVERFYLSKKGKYFIFSVNENGFSKLYQLNTETLRYKELKIPKKGILGGVQFHPKKSRFACTLHSYKSAGDVFVYDMKKGRFKQWTFSETGGLNTELFCRPKLFHYPTFDKNEKSGEQRSIPAFLYLPETKGPHPVVIDIHGGPESQYRPGFRPLTQFLVKEMQFAVIAPNVRGSTGYGKSYHQLDNGYLREDSVKDIGNLLDWIAGEDYLDSSRIAVSGGSYGGYMVLASMIHFGDRLKCGVDRVGISNFVTFLKNTKSYRRNLRRREYGDERDPKMKAFLESISPTNHAHKIDKPMLIYQGQNDPRVPMSEAVQMVEKIRQNNTPVWYVLGLNEGHSISRKSNRIQFEKIYLSFLEKYL